MAQTPTQANRALACLSKIMGLGERWGLRPSGSNPCRHVPKVPEKRREPYLSDEEIGRLGRALEKAQADGGSLSSFLLLVRLLLFTGARLDEIRLLRWENVDLEDLRLHDLRHSYASVGVGAGRDLPPIGALLGHRQPSTTARYAHIADTVRRRSADLIDEKLRAALRRPSES